MHVNHIIADTILECPEPGDIIEVSKQVTVDDTYIYIYIYIYIYLESQAFQLS